MPSGGAEAGLAGITVPLPDRFYFRTRNDEVELFAEPGVFCDSGDWSIVQTGYLRLRHYDGAPPDDPFRDFPPTHAGHMREQIDLGVGPLVYPLQYNNVTWQVHAFFSNAYQPRLIFMYLTSEVSIDDRPAGLAIHSFPGGKPSAVPEIIAAIGTLVH